MRHSFTESVFDPNNYQTYNASCHCGQIRYKADVSPPLEADHEVVTCDCAMCIRTGAWNVYVPIEKVTFTRGKEKLRSYHYYDLSRDFCPNCGNVLTGTLVDPNHKDAGRMALNVRAFRDIGYDKIKIRYVTMKDEDPQWDPDALSMS